MFNQRKTRLVLGRTIKNIRLSLNLSQNFVAGRIGCDRKTLCRWELGGLIVPLYRLAQFSLLFNFKIEEVFKGGLTGFRLTEYCNPKPNKKEILSGIGPRIKEALDWIGPRSYEDFGDSIGVHRTTVHKWVEEQSFPNVYLLLRTKTVLMREFDYFLPILESKQLELF